MAFQKKHRYEVTRKWYVTATSQAEALSKSKQVFHTEVQVKKLNRKDLEDD